MFLEDNTDIHPTYHLRPTVRPLFKYPKVDHVFAKSSVLYQLVSLFNTVYSTCPDILKKKQMKKVTLTRDLVGMFLKSFLKNILMNVVFWYVTHVVEHNYQ